MARQFHGSFADEACQARYMPVSGTSSCGPEGALIPDGTDHEDTIAVVYDRGDTPPKITIAEVSGDVQAVLADGVAVAVVACADGPKLTVEDVLLVERFVRAGC